MDKEEAKSHFSEQVKKLRKSRNLSQYSMAKKFNISQGTVAAWEAGTREPSLEKINSLCEGFGVTADYLLGRTDNPLTTVSENTPYLEVTPFEREFLDRYRHASEGEQVSACRVLGAEHPAETRLRAKKASS